MATRIAVTRTFDTEALLTIHNPDSKHWYELGVWWAMYGDCQGKGPYADTYLIDGFLNGITNGWYNDPHSGWFEMVGFKLGMIHGGYLICPSDTLVILTDPDFRKGYFVGRDYHYTEAVPEGSVFSDKLFNENVRAWALGYHEWREPEAVLAYCLGCLRRCLRRFQKP